MAALDTYGAAPTVPYQPYGMQQMQQMQMMQQMQAQQWGMHGQGPCDVMPWQGLYMDPSMYPSMGYDPAMMGGYQQQPQSQPKGRREKKQSADYSQGRDRTKSGNSERKMSAEEQGWDSSGPCTFTTVMFRNIPNKYTRDMLVKQLEESNLKGQFDFVYMPIDFKHQCNVGYAFINFRTIPACEIFLKCFNNFEVNKCMPGINSRKVAEVTPARVQGLDENVQRLRNSPVMLELAAHPEWMPLIFDENGEPQAFPEPERPLAPIKPRKKSS